MRSFDELPEDARRFGKYWPHQDAQWRIDVREMPRTWLTRSVFDPSPANSSINDDRFAYWAEVEYEHRQLRAAERRKAQPELKYMTVREWAFGKAQKCDACGGSGWTAVLDGAGTCTACNGTGRAG